MLRQPALEAFIQSIKSYPYADASVIHLTGTGGIRSVFDSTSGLKQLATIIDRNTYIGACELLLSSSDVSLQHPLESAGLDCALVGAILERQLDCMEGSLWKEGVHELCQTLLQHALKVYSAQDMPIRRARVLVRCLRLSYKAGGEISGSHPDDIGDEVEELLSREVYFLHCPKYVPVSYSHHPRISFMMQDCLHSALNILHVCTSGSPCMCISGRTRDKRH